MSYDADQVMMKLLNMACDSVENQACWDKQPFASWYYEAQKVLKRGIHADEPPVMYTICTNDEMNRQIGKYETSEESLNKHIASLLVKATKGKKTARGAANAAHKALCKYATKIGYNAEKELFISVPKKGQEYFIVCWESGPFQWADNASMALTVAHGAIVEPRYSFDLCFYPNEYR